MFNKIVLIQILVALLLGAALLAAPIPVLWGMACLAFIALALAMRSQHQG